MLLDADTQFENSRFIMPGIRKPPDLLDDSNHLIGKYAEFFNKLPFYLELDNFFLVHAGFNTKLDEPFTDTYSMIWIDSFDYEPVKLKGKRIIHGHTSVGIDDIKSNISNNTKIIPLDNGVNNIHSINEGNLVCLDIDAMVLTTQKNIDY
jgi:serine/threonine protein phosphatase 1